METLRQLVSRGAEILILDSPKVDTYAGFICFEKDRRGQLVLHYLFIKAGLRQRRFSQQLLSEAGFTHGHRFTHRTKDTAFIRVLGPYHRAHKPELARQKDI